MKPKVQSQVYLTLVQDCTKQLNNVVPSWSANQLSRAFWYLRCHWMVVMFRVEMGSLSSPKPHCLARGLVCTRVWCEVGISHLDPGKELGLQGGRHAQQNSEVKVALCSGDVWVEGG